MWDEASNLLFTIWTVGFQNPDVVRTSVQKLLTRRRDCALSARRAVGQRKSSAARGQQTSVRTGRQTRSWSCGNGLPQWCQHEISRSRRTKNSRSYSSFAKPQTWYRGAPCPYEVKKQSMSHIEVPKLTSVSELCRQRYFAQLSHRMWSSAVRLFFRWSRQLNGHVRPLETPGLVHTSVTFTPVDAEWFAFAMNSANKNPHVVWAQAGPGSVMVTLLKRIK